jgi:methionine biosynthesis protein MetW
MALGRFMRKYRQGYEKYWKERERKADKEQNERLFPNEVFEAVYSILRYGRRLLDVGCGNGNLVDIAIGKFVEVHGCDISEMAVQEAKKRGIRGVCLDLNELFLPYKTESFDAITCVEVIEHVLDPIHFLRELHRILQPRGQLILSTPNIRYFRNLTKLLFHGNFPHTSADSFVWGGGHVHYFTIKDLGFLLLKAGFHGMTFHVNQEQFRRSWKRRLIVRLVRKSIFREWFCGGILAEVYKG